MVKKRWQELNLFLQGLTQRDLHYRIPNLDLSLIPFGEKNSREQKLEKLKVVVWNVNKFYDPHCLIDLADLVQNADLILLQEFRGTEEGLHFLNHFHHRHWHVGVQFHNHLNQICGVAIGLKDKAQVAYNHMSTYVEPISRTPKAILEVKYANSVHCLHTFNIHALNFVGNQAFQKQMLQLFQRVEQTTGPLIVAGDFNTWSMKRYDYVMKLAEGMGLTWVETPQKRKRMAQLDHAFVRGFKVYRAEFLENIDSSDHLPLTFELEMN